MTDKLQMAVNHALMMTNAYSQQDAVVRSREAMLAPMGMDAKRATAWCEYGFKEHLDFFDLYKAYRRGGLAFSAVNKLNGKCFSTYPEIIEGEEKDKSKRVTPWERSLKNVIGKKLWRAFAEADKRRLAGHYSGILIHYRDSNGWNQPVSRGAGIEKFTVAWESCLQVKEYDVAMSSENYGKPKMWQYTAALPNGGRQRFDVHPDRVFIVGDYTLDCIGFLEPGYNNLVSLEKVEGGSGESFLKNAARQLALNFEKGIDFNSMAQMYGVDLAELQETFNEVAVELNRGNDAVIMTQGATTSPIVANVPDPTPTYDINLQSFSASVDIPGRILVGNQQAERSSTEDSRYFNARCQGRRVNELSFEIEDFVNEKLIGMGVIKGVPEFTVVWDDLNEQTQSEKLDNAVKMTGINEKAIGSGQPIFEDSEIRTTAGFEGEEMPEPLPESDIDDEQE